MQDVALLAGRYELSFAYSPRVDQTPTTTNNLGFGLERLDGSSVAYTQIDGAPNPDYPWGEWSIVTEIYEIATAGTYRLLFQAEGEQKTGNCNCGALIDTVAMTELSGNTPAPVPLPAGRPLLGAGLGLMAFLRRRG